MYIKTVKIYNREVLIRRVEMKKLIPLILIFAIILSVAAAAFAYPVNGETMLISADNISYEISNFLYGISLEDVSFGINGGLSANMVNNNSFEYSANRLAAWSVDTESYSVQNKDGIGSNNVNYLSVTVDGEGSVSNKGYTEFYNYKTYNFNEKKKDTPDMGFKKGEKYEFSACFKNVNFIGNITVSLNVKGNGGKYEFTIDDCEEWTKIISLIESDATGDGDLLITARGTGTFYMDFVSLIPESSHGFHEDKWKYTSLRDDLFEAISGLSPKFVRFPGGKALEGENLDTICNWKDTIGALESRQQTVNPWRDDAGGKSYNNSNEMGYYEYFLLCEDLDAMPIPVVNAGISCQDNNGYEKVRYEYSTGVITEDEWQKYLDTISLRPGTEEFVSYVNDILDLIEYANGGADTTWGKVRAENGHEEPFGIQYIEIGCENRGEVYWRNFDEIYKAVKEKYPEITVIATAGEGLASEYLTEARKNANTIYKDIIVDEHYAGENDITGKGTLFSETERFDQYERTGSKVMVGEWSVKSNGYGSVQTENNIWSAIEGAAFLTGIERNGDIVQMVSYAPVLSKLNAQNKNVSLIWFDSEEICLTPDYYMQMIFANNCGDKVISTDFNLSDDGVYHSVTVDTEKKVIYVKLVNSQTGSENITLDFDGFGDITTASMQYLSEVFKPACNEIGEKLHVAPKEKTYEVKDNKLNLSVEGLSVNVLRIPYDEESENNLYTLPSFGVITPYIHPAIEVTIPCVIVVLFVVTIIVVLIHRQIIGVGNRPKFKKKKNKGKRQKEE